MPKSKRVVSLAPVLPSFQRTVVIKANPALPADLQEKALARMQTYLTEHGAKEVQVVPITGNPTRSMLTCTILSAEETMNNRRPVQYIYDQANAIKYALMKEVQQEASEMVRGLLDKIGDQLPTPAQKAVLDVLLPRVEKPYSFVDGAYLHVEHQ